VEGAVFLGRNDRDNEEEVNDNDKGKGGEEGDLSEFGSG